MENLYDAAASNFSSVCEGFSFRLGRKKKERQQGKRDGKKWQPGKEKKYSCSCVLEWRGERAVCGCGM